MEPRIHDPETGPGIDVPDINDCQLRPASRTPSAHRRNRPAPASNTPVGRTLSAT